MKLINGEFVTDLAALLKKHGIKSLNYPHALGQSLDQLKGTHLSNSYEWMTGNMTASYALRNNVNTHIKDLIVELDKRKEKPHNYNDLDCDLYGKHSIINNACLECDAFIAKMEINGKKPNTENGVCVKCGGSKIDPEFKDNSYVVLFNNHGNSLVYVLKENPTGYALHIRRLRYNLSKSTCLKLFNKFVEASKKDRYDSDFDYMRYHDKRDNGFVFSMSFYEFGGEINLLDCESDSQAPYALTAIVEHFPIVFED